MIREAFHRLRSSGGQMEQSQIVKHVVDGAAVGVTAGVWATVLPSVASGLTVIWMLIRIYETKTVQDFVARFRPSAAPTDAD